MSMKGLNVILTTVFLVLTSRLATRMKPATVLSANPQPVARSPVLDSTFNASAALNHAETIPQE
jgi:hypothetical protein